MEKRKCSTEIFSRVCGFFRPISDWNPGKGIDGEYSERKVYDLKKDTNPLDSDKKS